MHLVSIISPKRSFSHSVYDMLYLFLAETVAVFSKRTEGTFMQRIFELVKGMVRKSLERDRASERYVEALSRSLWPWRESWLLALVSLLVVLDYASTYAALELSGKAYVYEGGPLASWALQMGGFVGLLLIDVIAASALLLIALTVRFIYSRFGFRGYGRTAFVVILVPYAVVTMAVIFNNVVLTFI